MFVAVCQDAAGAHSQRQLDHLRQGHASQGAAWLRAELVKQNKAQLGKLASTAGVQQHDAGRTLTAAELVEGISRRVSQDGSRV